MRLDRCFEKNTPTTQVEKEHWETPLPLPIADHEKYSQLK
jgi:hypothetical protein